MTVRERLLAVLRKQQPDRVPVWPWINPYDPVWEERDSSYKPVVEHVRKYADVFYRWSFPTGFAYTAAEVFEKAEEAVSERGEPLFRHTIQTPKGPLFCLRKVSPYRIGAYPIRHWIESLEDLEKFLSIPTEICHPSVDEFLKKREEIGEAALMQVNLGDPVCVAGYFKEELFPLWAVEHTALIKQVLDIMFERIYGLVEYLLQNGVGPVFHFSGPEYSIPPLLSPKHFEEFVVKYDTPLVELIHRYGAYVVIHSHGRVSQFLERFADMGIDALNVLEGPPMGDVDMAEAKRRVGHRFCLCGNIEYDNLERLPSSEIEAKVKEIIQKAGAGGGLIVSPCCSPYSPTLPEQTQKNYIAMINATRKYGRY